MVAATAGYEVLGADHGTALTSFQTSARLAVPLPGLGRQVRHHAAQRHPRSLRDAGRQLEDEGVDQRRRSRRDLAPFRQRPPVAALWRGGKLKHFTIAARLARYKADRFQTDTTKGLPVGGVGALGASRAPRAMSEPLAAPASIFTSRRRPGAGGQSSQGDTRGYNDLPTGLPVGKNRLEAWSDLSLAASGRFDRDQRFDIFRVIGVEQRARGEFALDQLQLVEPGELERADLFLARRLAVLFDAPRRQ